MHKTKLTFPKLRRGEVRILLLGSGGTFLGNHFLHPGGRDRIRRQGRALTDTGLRLHSWSGPPEVDAMQSALALLEGLDRVSPGYTDDCVYGLTMRGLSEDVLHRRAARRELPFETYLLRLRKLSPLMQRAGEEGASKLDDEAVNHDRGQPLLYVAHHYFVSVILLALLRQNDEKRRRSVASGRHPRVKILPTGQLIEIIMRNGRLKRFRYLTNEILGIR